MITPFQKKVYKALKKVPKGKVTTYQELAHAVNSKAYRTVGTAMKKNPFAPIVPCHRVINANGSIGNYTGQGGVKKKIELLQQEGVVVEQNKIDLKKYLYKFK